MSLERMFQAVEGLRETASADLTLGEPRIVEGRVFIPVAAVGTGFGLGFDQEMVEGSEGADPEGEEQAEGGVGGGAGSRPLAVIEVTPEETVVRPILDETKIALAGIALVGWVVFWLTATVRTIFGSE